tara:strand:- start:499 stop:678 length:180 start_codon:yes stop_codon:yes gene_type:complete
MELDEMEEAMRQLESVQDQVADWATDEILENLEALVESMEELISTERARIQEDLEEDED